MSEAHRGPVPISRDPEADFRALPLGSVFGEAEVVLPHAPDDLRARDEFNYLDSAAMDVLVSIGELGATFVGAAFNFLRPPSTNVIDGIEHFFRRLVYGEADGEVLILHGEVSFHL
jgi:hypothetical protein